MLASSKGSFASYSFVKAHDGLWSVSLSSAHPSTAKQMLRLQKQFLDSRGAKCGMTSRAIRCEHSDQERTANDITCLLGLRNLCFHLDLRGEADPPETLGLALTLSWLCVLSIEPLPGRQPCARLMGNEGRVTGNATGENPCLAGMRLCSTMPSKSASPDCSM